MPRRNRVLTLRAPRPAPLEPARPPDYPHTLGRASLGLCANRGKAWLPLASSFLGVWGELAPPPPRPPPARPGPGWGGGRGVCDVASCGQQMVLLTQYCQLLVPRMLVLHSTPIYLFLRNFCPVPCTPATSHGLRRGGNFPSHSGLLGLGASHGQWAFVLEGGGTLFSLASGRGWGSEASLAFHQVQSLPAHLRASRTLVTRRRMGVVVVVCVDKGNASTVNQA